MSITSYPLLEPPEDLAAKTIDSWSAAEADRYKEWLLASMPGRVKFLRATLSLPSADSPESTLLEAGRKLVALLAEPSASMSGRHEAAALRGHEISYHTGPLLTVHGYAISADMGLLMAELLTDRYELHWDVVRRPKRDVAYNRPALFGFRFGLHLDPIQTSAAAALGVLDGSAGEARWSDIYRRWAEDAPPRRDLQR